MPYPPLSEHPYPAALEDAMKVWDYLMLLGYGARDVILAGGSAGGNPAPAFFLCSIVVDHLRQISGIQHRINLCLRLM